MASFPAKISREALRILFQIADLPRAFFEYYFSTYWYDHVVSKQKKIITNRSAQGSKFAIYLIFPKQGLLESHLIAIGYLKQHDFNVVVVSNLPLSANDKGRVLEACWTVIERPNYGYDFGGYRDGILMLAPYFENIERLVLLNDSTWFPLPGKSDWLSEVESLNVDFCGAISAYGVSRQQAKNHRSLVWEFSTQHSNFNYCSFALAFSKSLVNNPQFIRFWRKLKLTNRKNKTVRRGEIGLTQLFTKGEMTHGSTFNVAAMDAELQQLSGERILKIAQRIVLPLSKKHQQLKSDVLARASFTDEWRTEAIKYILRSAVFHGASYSTAEFNVNEKQFPFLKKTPVSSGGESADISVAILNELEGPTAKIFQLEAGLLMHKNVE